MELGFESALALALGLACVAAAAWLGLRAIARSRALDRLDVEADEAAALGAQPGGSGLGLLGAALIGGAVVAASGVAIAFSPLPLLVAVVLGLDAGVLVWLFLQVRIRRRDLRIEEQVARAVMATRASLRSGRSPAESLRVAADGAGAPFGPLLADAAGRLRLGEDVEDALAGLTRAAPLASVRLLVFALSVQWRAGGSLERSLDTVGTYVRDRVELQRRIETQAAPARSSVLALFGATLAVAFLAWSNDPANVGRFVASGPGTALVATTLFLQGGSLLWMWRLARVRL